MTNPELNLKVLTDHIHQLADAQSRAADQVTGANRAIAGVSDRVRETHGLICALASTALATADETRASLGSGLFQRSTELSGKLTTAASNYEDTDYLSGRAIGSECRW